MTSFSLQSGMALIMTLIFLAVTTLLALGAIDNNILNQKMHAASQAEVIALNGAEAGIIAEEAKLNGQTADLSSIKAQLDYGISNLVTDTCQQQTFTLFSTATYQHTHIKLISAYLKTHQPPLPNCPTQSHRLWWQQVDFSFVFS
jgi:Tfp pilus assembly protein PilX